MASTDDFKDRWHIFPLPKFLGPFSSITAFGTPNSAKRWPGTPEWYGTWSDIFIIAKQTIDEVTE